ncbi:MAG: hypothetical protein ACLVJB_06025 [Christensenellales bacterium]
MNDNPIRRAVDTRLSGLAFTPQMQADTLRRARLCNQPPHMRRKLSYSLAFALLALLLAATAGAAAYFGVPVSTPSSKATPPISSIFCPSANA